MYLLAIDPGPEQSGFVLLDPQGTISKKGILRNATDPMGSMQNLVRYYANFDYYAAIEMPKARGQRAGDDLFHTCRWVGRFQESWDFYAIQGHEMRLIARQDVVYHFCGARNVKGADSAIYHCMLDHYGPGRHKAMGTKKHPGPVYGFHDDLWQALALGLYVLDTMPKEDVA